MRGGLRSCAAFVLVLVLAGPGPARAAEDGVLASDAARGVAGHLVPEPAEELGDILIRVVGALQRAPDVKLSGDVIRWGLAESGVALPPDVQQRFGPLLQSIRSVEKSGDRLRIAFDGRVTVPLAMGVKIQLMDEVEMRVIQEGNTTRITDIDGLGGKVLVLGAAVRELSVEDRGDRAVASVRFRNRAKVWKTLPRRRGATGTAAGGGAGVATVVAPAPQAATGETPNVGILDRLEADVAPPGGQGR